MNKIIFAVFALFSLASLVLVVQPTRSQSVDVVSINIDGSISGTNCIRIIGNSYILSSNIFGSITVQKDDITIDGEGYSLQGDGSSTGIILSSKNVTIKNFHLTNFYSAISSLSENNAISGNQITRCGKGITTEGNNCTISGNYLENNDQGIAIGGTYNFVSKNSLEYNRLGFVFSNGKDFVDSNVLTENSAMSNGLTILVTSPAQNNKIYGNNFVGSKPQVSFQNIPNGANVANFWDDGFRGNYWSDYLTTHPNAIQIDSTGTGNLPYSSTLSPVTSNVDNHPLMNPLNIIGLPQGHQKLPSTGNENIWKKMSPMPTARSGHGLAVVNGKIYVIGGVSYTTSLSVNEMYDPATNSWTTMAPIPTARGYFGIAVYQDKIYVIGGMTGPGQMGAVLVTGANEVYDPATNTWQSKTQLPVPREQMQANMVNGKIYVIGGTKCSGMLNYQSFNDNNVYDPENDSWTTAGVIPTASWCYASTVLDNKIYIIDGGAQKGANLAYDLLNNNWHSGAAIPSKFFSLSPAAASTAGVFAPKRIYVMGGTTGGLAGISINQAYNPNDDSWNVAASMPTARYDLAVATVNDTLYAIGGATGIASGPGGGWIPTNANEQYTPIGYGTIDAANQNTVLSLTEPLNPSASGSPLPSSPPTLAPSTSTVFVQLPEASQTVTSPMWILYVTAATSVIVIIAGIAVIRPCKKK